MAPRVHLGWVVPSALLFVTMLVVPARHSLSFPIPTFSEAKLAALYGTRVVPQLLLLDSAGVVLYARPGVLEGKSGDRFGPPSCSRSTLTLGG